MLKVVYRLKLGQDEFELQAEVKDERDFFEQMSFYSNLPRTAPKGATDLKLVFRTTKKGHKYYSLISEIEQMEFRLGQNLEANGGGLYPKGWQKAYQSESDDQATNETPAPAFGAQPPKTVNNVPETKLAAAPAFQMPQPQVITQPVQTASASTPKATEPRVDEAPKVANPQVAAVANNVLSRFGIKQ